MKSGRRFREISRAQEPRAAEESAAVLLLATRDGWSVIDRMTPDAFRRALVLTGPTGSGKSSVALELAPRLDAEIVAMDSMTLYRGMDIGTAKPSAAERACVPHHLLDVLDPWQSASVAWWLGRA